MNLFMISGKRRTNYQGRNQGNPVDTHPSLFSWPLFIGLYLFFVLDTLLSPALLRQTLISAYPKFAITRTAHLYQLLEKNTHATAQAAQSTTQTGTTHHLLTYVSVAVHNSLLVLIAVALFAATMFLPRLHNRILFHLVEYFRLISTLFFFSFGPMILFVNALLIPFILGTLAYAAHVPTYLLGAATLVHGMVEYAALSLLIMMTIQCWRFTWSGQPAVDLTILSASNNSRNILKQLMQAWYRSIFSPTAISHRFRLALASQKRAAFRLYGLAVLIFFAAGIVEIYISPSIGTALLAHS